MALFKSIFKTQRLTNKEFKDPPNTAVFTTKFVIKNNRAITYVAHDEDDGAWQFFSDDEFDIYEDVAMLVGLYEIVGHDPTLLELADLPLGQYATRKNKNDKWTNGQYIKNKKNKRSIKSSLKLLPALVYGIILLSSNDQSS